MQVTDWLFTDNSIEQFYSPVLADYSDPFEDKTKISYGVWQVERAPTTGRLHLQGLVIFTRTVRLSAVQRVLPHAHWLQRRGPRSVAIAYCRKENSREAGPYEFGELTPSEQGKRSDLSMVQEKLDGGAKMSLIATEHFGSYCRYRQSFAAYKTLKCDVSRSSKSYVTVCWGPTGTGKTTWVQKQAGLGSYWCQKSSDGSYKWFDGYEGQADVIFDEFSSGISHKSLLNLLDFSPATVEIKGGSVNWAPERIWITSNKSPTEWYTDHKLDHAALFRRLDQVLFFSAIDEYTLDIDEAFQDGDRGRHFQLRD